MNKIYKVIWSKAKGCYIVVSELAKNVGKNSIKRIRNIRTITVAMLILSLTTYGTVLSAPITTTKDTENNIIVGTDNTVIQSQADTTYYDPNNNTRQDINPGNLIMGNRNAIGIFQHDTSADTSGFNTDNYDLGYQLLKYKDLTITNPITGTTEVIKVVDTSALGQYLDDLFNINRSGADENPRNSYYVTGATVVGIDSLAEGDKSTAIGNNARVLNSTTSYYVKSDGSLTTDTKDAYWYRDDKGNKVGYAVYDSYGYPQYYTVTRYYSAVGSVAIGHNVTADGAQTIAIGDTSHAHDNGVAIGSSSNADVSAVAIGYGDVAQYGGVALGHRNEAQDAYSLAAGYSNKAKNNSTAIGQYNDVNAEYGTASGYNNTIEQNQGIASGYGNNVKGENGIVVGQRSTVAADSAVAVGNTASASGKNSIAFGSSAKADKAGSIALGLSAQVGTEASVALGQNAKVSTINSVSLGSDSQTKSVNTGAEATKVIKSIDSNGNPIYDSNKTYAGLAKSTNGSISVGKINAERQIQNVAAGAVSASSTDAVNGSELFATENKVSDNTTNINNLTKTVEEGWTARLSKTTGTLGSNVSAIQITPKDNKNTLGFVAGKNITLTGDNTARTITVAAVDDYVTSGKMKDSKTLELTRDSGTSIDIDMSTVSGTSSDYRLIVNPASSSGDYKPDSNGKIALKVQNGTDATTATTVTISDVASKATLDKGLKFGANSGDTVTNKLGSTVNVKGTGTKDDTEYSGKNVKTSVSQDADGNTTVNVMLDKNLTGDSVTVGGKDGKDGVDGSVGVAGKDGTNGVTITAKNGTNGTEGHIGLTGAKGADGKDGASADITVVKGENGVDGTDGNNGKDGMDRVEYTDHNKVTHEVATLDDGLNFKGDNKTVITKKLNDTMDIKGGADGTKLSDNNIGVVAENGALNVKLSKDLTGLNSVTTGDTTMTSNGITIKNGPTFTKTTVDAGGNKITNVAAGDVNATSTDAVNGSQLYSAAAKATTEVKAGVNVDSVVNNPDKNDNHAIYTVNVKDMTVKSGTVTYTDKGAGTATLTNGNGTTATVTGLKDTYTKSAALSGTTETFTRNDGTTYDVDLSSLSTSITGTGLKFGANSGDTVTNKLGSTVNVKGAGTKEDTEYSGKNVKTSVSQDVDGNTTVNVMLDKNLTGDSVTVGGKDGVNGYIGVAGKDGTNGVTITAKDGTNGAEGHIGLTGAAGKDGKNATADITVVNGKVGVDGTDGKNGKDGMDRVEYTDHNKVTHEVATLDDGLKFKGDNETVIAKKLNETMDIKGGADGTKLSDNNIGVVAENGALNVKLAKDLKGLNSVTTGDTTMTSNGITIKNGPTFTKTTVDVGGNKITNVAAGDVNATSTDAVNGSQLYSAAAAATTEVKKGANVDSVVNNPDKNDGHAVYTINVKDMTVKSGTATYTDKGAGTATLTNGNGTTATVTGLKDTYTKSAALSGTTETFTRNDGTTYDVDLSSLSTSITGTGLKFGANSGDTVTNKLGSTVNVKGAGTKEDTEYSGKNIKTKVSQDANGDTTIDVMMDKNIDANSVKVGKDGADGTPGKDGVSITGPGGLDGKDGLNGKVGVTGTDGKDAVSISGKDGVGHIGLTGAKGADGKDGASADITVVNGKVGVDGTDGKNGKDGMDRVEYTDHNKVTHEVATLDDGLKFKGDNETVIAKKLNETMDIKGGADGTKLSDNNIGVVAENGALNVKLAKDLKGLNSTQYVDASGNTTTTVDSTGVTVKNGTNDVSLTKSGLSNGGNKITNVAAGDVNKTSTDAVNGSQLYSAAAAATTEVKAGANVDSVVNNPDKNDGHAVYTVNVKDMTVKSGTVTYTDKGAGTATLTNGNGTTATVTGLKDTYTKSGSLKDTTETFTRNDGTTYDVDLSGLTDSVTNKGLKFGANSGDTVTNKLGSTVNVKGAGTKDDTEYSGKNIKTKVSQDTDGNTTIDVMMDKNIDANSVKVGKDGAEGTPGKDGVSITGPGGLDGKDGLNGKVGVTGTDGKDAVSISGKDGVGHIGLTGAKGADGKDGASADITVVNGKVGVDGTDGKNGKDGMDRVEYTDHNKVTHEVATLDDGLKYGGDTGDVIALKLNSQLDVKGGVTDTTKLTDNNIGVVSDGKGTLNVKLAKDLKGLNSTQYVDASGNTTTTVDSTGVTVKNGTNDVSLTKYGLSNGGNTITNVAKGVNGTDAVNVDQLNKATAAATSKVVGGTNTTVISKTNGDGSTTYQVNLNSNITLGTDPTKQVNIDGDNGTITAGKGDKAVTIDGTKATITAGTGDKAVTIDGTTGTMTAGKVKVGGTDSTVTGLSNKTWEVGVTKAVSGRAATEDQLKSVSDATKEAGDLAKQHSTVTVNNGNSKGSLVLNTSTNSNGGNNYDVSLADNINVGGNNGQDGSIGVNGKDGSNGVTITAKAGNDGSEGHIGLTGAKGTDGSNATADIVVKSGAVGVDGTDGNNGKNGMDRVEYTDHNKVTHEVATMDDGMKYKGDTGSADVKLNQQVSVVGETTTGKNLTTGNIGVEATQDGSNAKLVVKLADNLTGIKNIETETIKATTVNSTTVNATTVNATTVKAGDTVTINNNGIDMGDTKVTNVKAGDITANSTDAVNGSQLYQTDTALNKLGNAVNDLDNRVDKVGAGAAALSALHPLDFDPDDKWDIAAGYGNYRGANAVAVGAFYRPDEDTMFSVGGSVGNGENMVNAGVSLKVGSHKNHVSTSRVAMAKEIKDMRHEMEEMRGLLASAYQGKKLDPTKLKLFPDIPDNHWAYDAIKQLAGNGIVEGYPDGNFDGDRMMTRYEFAMIVYRAMQKGANVNARLLNEFAPELERIRVDVISKDKNGKPDIERVRVIPGRG